MHLDLLIPDAREAVNILTRLGAKADRQVKMEAYNALGIGKHDRFLQLNPRVREMLDEW